MAESKFTPGPWEVTENKWCGHHNCPHGHITLMVVDAKGLPLHTWEADYGLEEARANARLIASAPDLLHALKRLLHETSDGQAPCHQGVVDEARAAIAKAKG